jgi:hypothetical protein
MTETSDQADAIYAEVGRLTMATAAIDNQLTILLSRLMSHTQDAFDYSFASVFMFSARSIDQRFEILRKAFRLRCGHMLKKPRHHNIRRAAEFAEKAMNVAISNIQAHRWVRNVAAHGNLFRDGAKVSIRPAMLDIEGQAAIAARGGDYGRGITLEHLQEATAAADADRGALSKLGHVFWSLLEWKEDPSELLGRANLLAQVLKLKPLSLQDPREGPPQRQRRNKKGDSPPTL